MSPAWIPAICAVFGLIVNSIWTALNVQMRGDLAKEIARMQATIAVEYVSEKMCAERMSHVVAAPPTAPHPRPV